MALTKRVEVLFDPKQYALLEQLARSRGALRLLDTRIVVLFFG